MGLIATLTSFTPGTPIASASVNANNTAIRDTVNSYAMFKDVAATVSVTHVFTPTQTFTGGATFGAAVTVSAGGVTITAGGLTVSAGGYAVTGNSTITGNLTVSGVITGGSLSGPASVAASSVTNGTFGAGAYTFPAALTVTTSCTAATFSGNGASLTALNAANVASGTLDAARLPATISAVTITTLTSDVINGATCNITKGVSDPLFLTASALSTWCETGIGAITADAPDRAIRIGVGANDYWIPLYLAA